MSHLRDAWDRDEREALEPLEDELATLRERHANDPPLELLRAADADALPPDLQARMSEHLAGSDWSRALVAGARDVEHTLDPASADRLFARIRRSADSAVDRSPRWRRWAPVAAVAATLAIVTVLWTSWRSTAPPAIGPQPPPQATVARAEPPISELIRKPDVRLSVAALTWRGQAASTLVDDLAPALEAFRQSDYARAAKTLEALEPRYPDVFDLPYYRGLSLLFLNDADGALPELQKAARLADSTFASDVAGYLAVAQQRAGKSGARR